jgi:nicotinate-nucleotide adenylyltransferase
VHNGHLALAQAALAQLRLDEVRWLPAGQPWQKADRVLAAPVHRREMVRIAIRNERKFVLDPREMQREGPTYTIETVRSFRDHDMNAQLVLILGADQYLQLPTWHRWRELLASVIVAVVARNGQAVRPRGALVGVWHRLELITMPEMTVSSTSVRAALQAGASIEGMVPPDVARYIAQHKLYHASHGPSGEGPHSPQ